MAVQARGRAEAIFVALGNGLPATEVFSPSQARDLMSGNDSAKAFLVLARSNADSDKTALEAAYDLFCKQLGLEGDIAQHVERALLPGLVLFDTKDLAVGGATWGDRVGVVIFQVVERSESQWLEQRSFTLESVRSALLKFVAGLPDCTVQSALAEIFTAATSEDASSLADRLDDLTRKIRDAVGHDMKGGVNDLMGEIFTLRTELRRLYALGVGSGFVLDYATQLHRALSDLDALSTFLATYQVGLLVRQGQTSDQLSKDRDSRLSKFVAALVLPTLWVTFWSTKAAPETVFGSQVSSVLGASAVIAGAVLAGVLAWFLVPHIGKVSSDGPK